jgi:hypothetical protein
MTISYPSSVETIKAEFSVNFDAPFSGGPIAPWGDTFPAGPGYGTGQRDVVYRATTTIVASGTLSLDLSGTLKQPDGVTNAVFKHINFIGIRKTLTSGAGVAKVIMAAANGVPGIFVAASDGLVLTNPGDLVCMRNEIGYVVTAGTGDLLDFAETGTAASVTLDILIIGKSV